jgi:hypothetical protein
MPHILIPTVAEIQGYYGFFQLSELVLQRIWHKQDYNHRHLTTSKGEPLRILYPGDWNRNEGPDFKGARLQIAGEKCTGDIELHLYPQDWMAHGHQSDPEYREVMLHVTLFEAQNHQTPRINHLALLPYLEEDLESLLTRYMLDQLVDRGITHEPWVDQFLNPPDPNRQHAVLLEKARTRWQQKLLIAEKRLERSTWEQVCHESMLEVLGYRRNRIPMHQIAVRYPITAKPEAFDPQEAFHSQTNKWKLRGTRPANHPLKRLESYHRMLRAHPDWPTLLLKMTIHHCMELELDAIDQPIILNRMQRQRQRLGTVALLQNLQHGLFHGEFGGSRIHTVMCDAFLPLIAAKSHRDLFSLWYLWQPGDCPEILLDVVRNTALVQIPETIQCNGWVQGLIQLGYESKENHA